MVTGLRPDRGKIGVLDTAMKVSVKLLTVYRSKLPEGTEGNTCTLQIPDGSRIEDLLNEFDIQMDAASVVLINGYSAKELQQLEEDDEVCVYSAMAGG
jgi:sulfur carrier protein ThiS